MIFRLPLVSPWLTQWSNLMWLLRLSFPVGPMLPVIFAFWLRCSLVVASGRPSPCTVSAMCPVCVSSGAGPLFLSTQVLVSFSRFNESYFPLYLLMSGCNHYVFCMVCLGYHLACYPYFGAFLYLWVLYGAIFFSSCIPWTIAFIYFRALAIMISVAYIFRTSGNIMASFLHSKFWACRVA